MALPNNPPIDLLAVGVEAGVSTPVSLIDAKIRTLAGKPTGEIGLLDLLGKSAAPAYTVGVNGFMSPTGSGSVRDRGVFTVGTSPTATITAWEWDYSDPGFSLSSSGQGTSSFTLNGPFYRPTDFNAEHEITIWCTVTIGGVKYRSANLRQSYTAPAF